MPEDDLKSKSFEDDARERPPGFICEFINYLSHNKKWWLTPIILTLLLISLLALAAGSGAAPFIYTLF